MPVRRTGRKELKMSRRLDATCTSREFEEYRDFDGEEVDCRRWPNAMGLRARCSNRPPDPLPPRRRRAAAAAQPAGPAPSAPPRRGRRSPARPALLAGDAPPSGPSRGISVDMTAPTFAESPTRRGRLLL